MTGESMSTLVEPKDLVVEEAGAGDSVRLTGLVSGARYTTLPSGLLRRLGELDVVVKGEEQALTDVRALISGLATRVEESGGTGADLLRRIDPTKSGNDSPSAFFSLWRW